MTLIFYYKYGVLLGCFVGFYFQQPIKQCPQLKIIRIDMSIYFGSVNHIQKRIAAIVENAGGALYFVRLKASVYEFAAKSYFIQQIGRSHFFDSKSQAIGHIHKKLEQKTCTICQALIFNEY